MNLSSYILNGNYNGLKEKIENGLPPHSEVQGDEWLVMSIKYNYLDITKLLLAKNCKVNRKRVTRRESTSLHHAVMIEDVEIVKDLLNKRAHVGSTNELNQTPLQLAVEKKNRQLIEHILRKIENLKGSKNVLKCGGLKEIHVACIKEDFLSIYNLCKKKISNVNQLIPKNALLWPGFTPLHIAVEMESVNLASMLLLKGANVNVKDVSNLTPLHTAFYSYNQKKTDESEIILDLYLSELTKKENPIDKDGLSHFHIACTRNEPSYIEDFINQCKNLDINTPVDLVPGYEGFTPLHFAVKFNNKFTVEVLINNGANVYKKNMKNQTALHLANELKQDELIEVLFSGIETLENPDTDNPTDEQGFSHFLIGCRIKNLYPVVMKFLNIDVDVDERVSSSAEDDAGNTALHIAVRNHCIETVLFLISFGADVNAMNAAYLTPLHLAAISEQSELAHILLKNGANPNLSSIWGRTPLYIAAEFGRFELSNTLLLRYAEVDHHYSMDNLTTAMHLAAWYKHFPVVELLLAFKANVFARDEQGFTVLHFVAEKSDFPEPFEGSDYAIIRYQYVVEEILNYGLDVNIKCDKGLTPLHVSAMKANYHALATLLNFGADIYAEDNEGNTALDYCKKQGLDPEFIFTFIHHLRKLKLINFRFTKKIDTLYSKICKQNLISTQWSLNEEIHLVDELNLMKQEKLDINTTLYDILLKKTNQMALSHVKNIRLVKTLESHNFDTKYRYYGPLIKLQFQRGLDRLPIIESAIDLFPDIIGIYLPDDALEKIFFYFSLEDLKNIIQSIKEVNGEEEED